MDYDRFIIENISLQFKSDFSNITTKILKEILNANR